ncbi:DUF6463 family protein [Kutzneria albida]|uniref:Uncharacterized protein n=1 Tax=Kutzneria albida DSM 43870 TaxID=1449976 RepID=W5WA14_9PSEU|nr:DUF6463 family protein [Kutzneria albida]AHH97757.1 hypothetical protein KALB_4395 [Kutzneria albida DSM 43870]
MTPTRWIPSLLTATGVLHLLYGAATLAPVIGDILGAGLVNAVGGHLDRQAAFWFLVAAPNLSALGELARWAVRRTGTLPARLGGWLLGIGVVGVVLLPVSGFWLVLIIGVLALVAARRGPVSAGA